MACGSAYKGTGHLESIMNPAGKGMVARRSDCPGG